MKARFSLLAAMLLTACAVSAQSVDDAIGEVSSNVKAFNPTSYIEAADAMKKDVEKRYPDSWLPVYYETLYRLEYSLRGSNFSEATKQLDRCPKLIDRLLRMSDVDSSEVYTLHAMYFIALSVQGGRVGGNGVSRWSDARSDLRKAIDLNPLNPRPQVLMLICLRNTAKNEASRTADDSNTIKTIRSLYDRERSSGARPSWGRDLLPSE